MTLILLVALIAGLMLIALVAALSVIYDPRRVDEEEKDEVERELRYEH